MLSKGLTLGVVLGLLGSSALAIAPSAAGNDGGDEKAQPAGAGDSTVGGTGGSSKGGSASEVRDHTFVQGLLYFGSGTPGCSGIEELSANAPPILGDLGFALTCLNAPPSSAGVVLVGDAVNNGYDPLGIGLAFYVDLGQCSFISGLAATSDSNGFGVAPAPLPDVPGFAGVVFYAQAFWWWGPSSCGASPMSSSTGLEITLLH